MHIYKEYIETYKQNTSNHCNIHVLRNIYTHVQFAIKELHVHGSQKVCTNKCHRKSAKTKKKIVSFHGLHELGVDRVMLTYLVQVQFLEDYHTHSDLYLQF